MSGPDLLATTEQVVETWEARARTKGFARPDGSRTSELSKSKRKIAAYVSDGRWVADCPVCNGGIAAWPEHDFGCCLDCGTVCPLKFPDPAEIADAVSALAARPPMNRHWRPELESARDLRHENIRFGYTPS
jgi:hypothetical protein